MQADKNLRILIIDDNKQIQNDFIKILQTKKSGDSELSELSEKLFSKSEIKVSNDLLPTFQIDTASQGQEGVELIKKSINQQNPYALAFVDIRMPPGWDGVETIKHIWEIDKDVQVVICTAYSDYTWEDILEELGERENLLILKKPFDQISVRQISLALTMKWQLLQATREHTQELESKIQERTKSVEFQALHDSLTNLPNRAYLSKHIKMLTDTSTHEMTRFALFFIDLDRFKLINDSFSHSVGDTILVSFSERMKKILRAEDFFARLGGDEFVLVISKYRNPDVLNKIANKILDELQKPFNVGKHEIIVSGSIGISIFPYNGKDYDELLKNADIAMYRAKQSYGPKVQFYSESLNNESLKKLEMETDLKLALENNEFFLVYQPQFNSESNTLLSVEALLRWNHKTKGVIYPIDFIPLAEEVGLFQSLGEWVIKTACEQNKAWQNKGLPPIYIAVNITALQFKQPNFVDLIKKILLDTKLEPHYLELELTENIIIDFDSIQKISELKTLGISISIDDFGTGYSSLNYLSKVPLDRLKIDKSFVQNITLNSSDELIIQAIINMANNLHLDVVAEGVETEKQLDFLKKNKCTNIQGFYFSKPVSSNDIEKMLKKTEKNE